MINQDRHLAFAAIIDDTKRVNCITVMMFIHNLKCFISDVDRVSTGRVFDQIVTAIHRDGFALASYILTRGVDTLRDDDACLNAVREIALSSLDRLGSMLGPSERAESGSA